MRRILCGVIISFSIVMLMAIPVLILSGCTDDNGQGKTDIGIDETDDGSSRAKIIFYFPGNQPYGWPAVRSAIEEATSLKLDFNWIETLYYAQRIYASASSGEAFDAFSCSKPGVEPAQFALDIFKMARDGLLKDITELLPENALSLYAKYSEQELDYAKIDGKLYAVPSLYPRAYCPYIYADDALLTKLDIDDISTMEEYDTFLKAVSQTDTDLTPGAIYGDTLMFANSFGYAILDDSKKLVYKWDDPDMKLYAWEKTPEFITLMQYLISWYDGGYINAFVGVNKRASTMCSCELHIPEETTTITSGSKESNPVREFILNPEGIVQRENPLGHSSDCGSFAFCTKSKNTEKALEFLSWVQYDPDNYNLLMYGIEGVNYVIDPELGMPVPPKGTDYKISYMSWQYDSGGNAFRNLDYDYTNKSHPRDYFDKYSRYAPHGAFYPEYERFEAALEQRADAFKDFDNRLFYGKIKNWFEVDNFIDRLQALGSDDIVHEVQRQLDIWNDGN